MGYDTTYNLEVDPLLTEEEWGLIEDDPVFDTLEDLDWRLGYLGTAYTSWYEHEDDMLALSLLLPEHEFTLSGTGDSVDTDDWIKHFKNGKMQARYGWVEYPPYDPEAFE